MDIEALHNHHILLNREVGLIEFYRRVLSNAIDKKNPLLERLNYLCIVSKNCDELFEVRVARLLKLYKNSPDRILYDGLNVKESLNLVRHHMVKLYDEIYAVYKNSILPSLAKENILIRQPHEWNSKEKKFAEEYFFHLQPILTPISINPLHPFPLVQNKNLHFAVALDGKDEFGRNSSMAIVEAPRVLPRVIQLPHNISNNKHAFMLLQDIISAHVNNFFHGMNVIGCYPFRVTRSADFSVSEDTKNIRQAVKKELNKRKYSECSRLELDISSGIPDKNIIATLLKQFNISEQDLYLATGPVNLSRLSEIISFFDASIKWKYPKLVQGIPEELSKEPDIFKAMQNSDILIHTPYQSFDPIFELTKSAAVDENVLAIKITVYRIGFNSMLIKNLIAAARAGKQVIASVELFARFDEENNVELANQLENAGVHVVYGVMGYKVHAKMLMIVRKEADGLLKQYVHIGTGNYNETTAHFYTDFGLLTTNQDIANDVDKIFSQITGIGRADDLKLLYQAPFTLYTMLSGKIENEIQNAKQGKKPLILAKMNSLVEPQIIDLLYKASCNNVEINLIVRGACLLKPGIKNLSENIKVISVVGRFLEHSRIFYFYNNGQEDLYLSSADWMQRNFFKRVEACTPILDKKIKNRIIEEGFLVHFKDNNDSWIMNSDGTYIKNTTRGRKFSSQKFLLNKLSVKIKSYFMDQLL